jgi:hypothetical protein
MLVRRNAGGTFRAFKRSPLRLLSGRLRKHRSETLRLHARNRFKAQAAVPQCPWKQARLMQARKVVVETPSQDTETPRREIRLLSGRLRNHWSENVRLHERIRPKAQEAVLQCAWKKARLMLRKVRVKEPSQDLETPRREIRLLSGRLRNHRSENVRLHARIQPKAQAAVLQCA